MNARHPLVRRAALIVTTVAAVSTTACDQAEDRAEVALSQSGVNLRSDVLAGTDVAGFVYTLTPIDCATGEANNAEGVVQTARDLENLLLPGGHPGFVDGPFAATSGHLFSDAFQALPPGCYGVIAQPIDADGRPSVDCAPAVAPNVAVAPERTTEVLLISQCDGDAIGALDVIAALNHAPEIVDLTYDPSKFTCGESTRICITVDDPDNDPLQIRAEGPEGVQVVLGRPVVDEDGRTVVCADVTVPGPGQYDIDWLVYDTMNGEGLRAAIVPIETQLPEGQTSHAHLVTPVHAMDAEACLCACPEGF
ncbi:MAG: hypothetical protein KC583_16775, partial [Myxococcales bacterium]|nr:hypothetical protein [Myxococcales bacterium]